MLKKANGKKYDFYNNFFCIIIIKMSNNTKSNINNDNKKENEKTQPNKDLSNNDLSNNSKNPITNEIKSINDIKNNISDHDTNSNNEIDNDNTRENISENNSENNSENISENISENMNRTKQPNNLFELEKNSYKSTKEYNIFKNELTSLINNNLLILKECKSNKRLLDIKYSELNRKINYIQISVILFSTLSGFLQSTKTYFDTSEPIVSVTGITISTYISLILSVSKYYKFDEKKELIHNLREKYANLHNKIEYRMDVLGPYTNHSLWEHQDASEKLKQWTEIKDGMEEEYLSLIETKQALTTEFESIMDSKSRNKNYIRDRDLVLNNRRKLLKALEQHNELEKYIKTKDIPTTFDSLIQLPDDDLNNWDDPV